MTDDVEATLRESQNVIARTEALLKEAGDAMERGEKLLADNNVNAEVLHAFVAKQNAEGRTEFEQAAQAIQEEIERDLPKQQAPARSVRVRPSRQMI
jgi:hypothetical protein